eukprot:PhM_4_TR18319/c0_g1_i1/m.63603/K03152/thiJ; protein deglycase
MENEEDIVFDFDPNSIRSKEDYDALSDVQQRAFRRYQYECSMSDEDRAKLREKRQKAAIERQKREAVDTHREARRKEEEETLLKRAAQSTDGSTAEAAAEKKELRNVVLVLWEGFEEMVAVTTIDVLRAAGCNVVITSISPPRTDFMSPNGASLYTKGCHGITLIADYNFELRGNASFVQFDAIIVPAGRQLMDIDASIVSNVKLIALLRKMSVAGKWVCGSCDAPSVLFPKAYITAERCITATPGTEVHVKDKCKDFKGEDSVVVDKHMITCRGSGDAVEFALNIVANVVDLTTALRVAKTLNYSSFTAKLQVEKKDGEKADGEDDKKKDNEADKKQSKK